MDSREVEAGHEIVMNFDQYPIGIKHNRIGTGCCGNSGW